MEKWIDLSFMDEIISMLEHDILQVFGINPVFMQFALVYILMMTLMVVIRPLIEWLMIHNWNTFASYIVTTLLILVFLQFVDRYARTEEHSVLPAYYWSVCLLSLSSFGVMYCFIKIGQRAWKRISKRSKNRAA